MAASSRYFPWVAFVNRDADTIESLRKDAERLNREWRRECADGDAVLQVLGLDPQDYRTDGGSLNIGKIRGRLYATGGAEMTKVSELIAQQDAEIASLRARLAEADALLRDIAEMRVTAIPSMFMDESMAAAARAYLSHKEQK